MKKLFGTLLIIFVLGLAARAAALEQHYTGAWYDTRNLTVADREAGELNMDFYDDGTLSVTIWYDGVQVATANSRWYEKGSAAYFSFTDSDGFNWRGTVRKFFLSGTFRNPTGHSRGRFQCNAPLNQPSAAANSGAKRVAP